MICRRRRRVGLELLTCSLKKEEGAPAIKQLGLDLGVKPLDSVRISRLIIITSAAPESSSWLVSLQPLPLRQTSVSQSVSCISFSLEPAIFVSIISLAEHHLAGSGASAYSSNGSSIEMTTRFHWRCSCSSCLVAACCCCCGDDE